MVKSWGFSLEGVQIGLREMMEKELLKYKERKERSLGQVISVGLGRGEGGGGAVSLYRVGVKSQEGKKEN